MNELDNLKLAAVTFLAIIFLINCFESVFSKITNESFKCSVFVGFVLSVADFLLLEALRILTV